MGRGQGQGRTAVLVSRRGLHIPHDKFTWGSEAWTAFACPLAVGETCSGSWPLSVGHVFVAACCSCLSFLIRFSQRAGNFKCILRVQQISHGLLTNPQVGEKPPVALLLVALTGSQS